MKEVIEIPEIIHRPKYITPASALLVEFMDSGHKLVILEQEELDRHLPNAKTMVTKYSMMYNLCKRRKLPISVHLRSGAIYLERTDK